MFSNPIPLKYLQILPCHIHKLCVTVICISFLNCLDASGLNLDINIQLKKGGSGTVQMMLENQASQDLKLQSEAIRSNLKQYGFNVTGEKVKSSTRTVSATFDNVFCLIRLLDSSQPFILSKKRSFAMEWDGAALTISSAILRNVEESADRGPMKLVIETEGEFLESSTGKISANRKQLSIDNIFSAKSLSFKVGSLAFD